RNNSRDGAWGMIARSDTGACVAAAAGKLAHMKDAKHAEAQACSAAVGEAVSLGLSRVIFESGSLTLVNAINTGSHDLSSIGVLIKEIRSLCLASFDCFSFVFCKRNCNKVAHELAQYGCQASVPVFHWTEYVPEFVRSCVASDIV